MLPSECRSSGSSRARTQTTWRPCGGCSARCRLAHRPTLFAPIEFEVDVEKRTGRIRVPGLVDTQAEPIRNPVTGAEHRARIDMPHGFEYRLAEIASGTSKVSGDLAMQLTKSHSHLVRLSIGQSGVIA